MEDKGANEARGGVGSSKFCFRPVEDQKLKFRINHGGSFVTSPVKLYMRVSKRSTSQYWQVTSLYGKHSCARTPGNRQAKTEWLAKKFIPFVRHTPNIKPSGLAAEAFGKWNVTINNFQAYRAKKRALELLQGAGSEQYAHLRNYAEELRRTNPNSTIIIKCGTSEIGPVFERIYVCLEACKAAFAYTCRPLIGLDACFLKGEHGGQLISAVGKDGNNQMIPIAYVVVESETRDSWKWFVDLLLEDLNNIQARNYAFISDQQKGLVEVIKEIGEHVEHRLCVKHLYGNWKKKYPGAQMKEILWKAARATTVPDWNRAMQRMKDIKEEAYTDMMKVQASQWTRSAFSTNTQSDLQVNNMCEAFNRSILEIRERPIISLLEGVKHYITVRIVKQRQMLEKATGDICPKIQQIIEKNKRVAGGWKATWHGDVEMTKFSVSNESDTYTVNVADKTCACRKWDLTGIPCAHVVACIWHNQLQPENFVSFYYRKTQALATYSHIILPSNGPSLWPVINAEFINPPVMRRAPGRPKKLRNKSNDEPSNPCVLPRQLATVKCKKCGKFGHNSRTCKGKSVADREIPKGGNKKKKTVGASSSGKGKGKAATSASDKGKGKAVATSASDKGKGKAAATSATDKGKTSAAASVQAAGPRPRKNKKTKVQEVPVVMSQGSQAPQTQPSQD